MSKKVDFGELYDEINEIMYKDSLRLIKHPDAIQQIIKLCMKKFIGEEKEEKQGEVSGDKG